MSILKGEAALARKLHAQKETTGRIISHPPSEAYAEGWERVFGKKACSECGGTGLVEGPHEVWQSCQKCGPSYE